MNNYQPTTNKVEVTNYPYGSLRTSMFFSLEFSPKRGFRAVTQTINPKTGRLNNPKKSTYNDLILLDYTEGFAKFHHFHFYEIEKLEDILKVISDNFDLFTQEQIRYLYARVYHFLKLTGSGKVTYCGAKVDEVMAVIKPAVEKALEGFKNPTTNVFNQIKIDVEALNKTEVEGYSPFTVTHYQIA